MYIDSRTAITQKLIAQVAAAAGADPATLTAETALQDVGFDSILLAITLRSLEVEFSIEFEDEDIAGFFAASSIGDYVGVMQRAQSRQTVRSAAAS